MQNTVLYCSLNMALMPTRGKQGFQCSPRKQKCDTLQAGFLARHKAEIYIIDNLLKFGCMS